MRLLILFFFSFSICFTQTDKKIYFTKKIDKSLSPVIDGDISDINTNLFGNLIENIKDSRPENTFLVKATFRIGS